MMGGGGGALNKKKTRSLGTRAPSLKNRPKSGKKKKRLQAKRNLPVATGKKSTTVSDDQAVVTCPVNEKNCHKSNRLQIVRTVGKKNIGGKGEKTHHTNNTDNGGGCWGGGGG